MTDTPSQSPSKIPSCRCAPLGSIERADVGERTIADDRRKDLRSMREIAPSSGEFVAMDIQYLDAPLR